MIKDHMAKCKYDHDRDSNVSLEDPKLSKNTTPIPKLEKSKILEKF